MKNVLFIILSLLAFSVFAQQNEISFSKELLSRAKAGDAQSQNDLARCYLNGYGVPANKVEARKWFMKSAKQGNPVGQYNLGCCMLKGIGGKQDIYEGLAILTKVADTNHDISREALTMLGDCYNFGKEVQKDITKANSYYIKASEKDSDTASHNMGVHYMNGEGVETDTLIAIQYLRKAADLGFVPSIRYLCAIYDQKKELDQYYPEIRSWLQKSNEQGRTDSWAEVTLGNYFMRGIGGSKEPDLAFSLYSKNAEKGSWAAMCIVGVCLYFGNGVEIDKDLANMWIEKAVNSGAGNACAFIGDVLEAGYTGTTDIKLAFEYYKKGAALNHPRNQYKVGKMQIEGIGTEKNANEGIAWMQKASDADWGPALYYLGNHAYNNKNWSNVIDHFLKLLSNSKYKTDDVIHGDILKKLSVCYRYGRGVEIDVKKADEYMNEAAKYGDPDAVKIQEWLNQNQMEGLILTNNMAQQ